MCEEVSSETLPEASKLLSTHPVLLDVEHPITTITMGSNSIRVNAVRTIPIPERTKVEIFVQIQQWTRSVATIGVYFRVEMDYAPTWTNQRFDFALLQYRYDSDCSGEHPLQAIYLFDLYPDPDAIITERYQQSDPLVLEPIQKMIDNQCFPILDTIEEAFRFLKYGEKRVSDRNIFGYTSLYWQELMKTLSVDPDENVYERSPEHLDVVLRMWFKQDSDELLLKKDYLSAFTHPVTRFLLIGDMIRAVQRTMIFNRTTLAASDFSTLTTPEVKIHYGLLGLDQLETIAQRIDNRIHTGRCDRVYPLYQVAQGTKLKHFKVKTTKVYLGDRKWKRIVVD